MAFTDHKITQFTHRIVDLPDQPTLPPDELKARFDSSSEELRVAHNELCDDADALEVRVDGHDTQINQISMEKFPDDTIQEKNLHPDLAFKLNGKADQTDLNEISDDLSERLSIVEAKLPQKCEVYIGSYVGDGTTSRTITLGFTPAAVLVERNDGARYNYAVTSPGGMALPGLPCGRGAQYSVEIVENGFKVRNKVGDGDATNVNNSKYMYLAFH